MLHRRSFATGLAAIAGLAAFPPARGDVPAGHSYALAIGPATGELPASFLGLSFETSELLRPGGLDPGNVDLVALLSNLTPAGVLRIGGNSSDRAKAPPTAAAIGRLCALVRQVGWQLIYGVNLGTGTPAQAAAEAAAALAGAGPALLAIQIGNEPDLFRDLRPSTYSVSDYIAEWRRFADAIVQQIPGVPFAGPDVGSHGEWLQPFGAELGRRIAFLSRHDYAAGPATSPSVTIDTVLQSGRSLDRLIASANTAATAVGRPIRMTETNSVYDGGKKGVSDTLAAASWAAGTMCRLANAGWLGVNFHGGLRGGPYSPLHADPGQPAAGAQPPYYALKLFARLGTGSILSVTGTDDDFDALAVKGSDGIARMLLVNRDTRSAASVMLPAAAAATALLLTAPSPQDGAVTLGGSALTRLGALQGNPTPLPAAHGRPTLDLPPASSVLIEMGG